MRIESMRIRSCRSFRVDDADLPAEARERLSAIRRFDGLRAAGCAERAALREVGISRRTLHRWKAALAAGGQRGLAPKSTRPRRLRRPARKPGDAEAVMAMRRKHPFMGKARVQRMLEHQGLRLSVSTVVRILSRAIANGTVPPASLCEGRAKPKRPRKFNGWARRWKYGDKAERPGQLVQIDHMTVSRDGSSIKEFRAIRPVSRFMAGFEDACRNLGVALRVLPPRRPQWNGCVERANRAARIEFWNLLDCDLTVEAVSERLLNHEFFHNYIRPHSAIDCRSPNDCLVACEAAQPQCHTS